MLFLRYERTFLVPFLAGWQDYFLFFQVWCVSPNVPNGLGRSLVMMCEATWPQAATWSSQMFPMALRQSPRRGLIRWWMHWFDWRKNIWWLQWILGEPMQVYQEFPLEMSISKEFRRKRQSNHTVDAENPALGMVKTLEWPWISTTFIGIAV